MATSGTSSTLARSRLVSWRVKRRCSLARTRTRRPRTAPRCRSPARMRMDTGTSPSWSSRVTTSSWLLASIVPSTTFVGPCFAWYANVGMFVCACVPGFLCACVPRSHVGTRALKHPGTGLIVHGHAQNLFDRRLAERHLLPSVLAHRLPSPLQQPLLDRLRRRLLHDQVADGVIDDQDLIDPHPSPIAAHPAGFAPLPLIDRRRQLLRRGLRQRDRFGVNR